jgi:tetratricopeptide (TPR) repeat protein
MSKFNYVYSSGLSYKEYLQAKKFVDEITSATRKSGRAVRMEISRQTREIIASREVLAQEQIRLRESLTEGFEILSYELQGISSGIKELNARFHWGFSQVIASIGRMNDALAELIKIAKTPAKTAAYEQYEIARHAFRRRLYPESLEAVEKAIATYKLDWRFHQLKGTLHLGSVRNQSLMDLAQAEESFLLAARYAKADYPQDAARAYLAAGWAAYCQGKLEKALAHTKEAIAIRPKLGEALFQAAKIHMALAKVNKALPLLERAIDVDHLYVLRAASDGDFQKHDDKLREFLEGLRRKQYQKCKARVQKTLEEIKFWLENSPEAKSDKLVQKAVQQLKMFLVEGKKWPLLDLLAWEQKQMDEWITKILDARPWWWKSAESLAEYQAEYQAALKAEEERRKEPAKVAEVQRERGYNRQKLEKAWAIGVSSGVYYGLIGGFCTWLIFGFGGCTLRVLSSNYKNPFDVLNAYSQEGVVAGLLVGIIGGVLAGWADFDEEMRR